MSDILDDLLEVTGALRDSAEAGGASDVVVADGGVVRADVGRERRKGTPEVILADRKAPDDVLKAVRAFLDAGGRAILSRVPPVVADRLREEHADSRVESYPASGMLVVKRPDWRAPSVGGCVGVMTAGTSDVPIAEEAQVVASEMGARVVHAYDVGVAGLHRLAQPLRQFGEQAVDVIVVAAGMDGALPSVVAGLVAVPVIGLPTSVGYGLGGRGVAALLGMLQSCAPGLTVVNIDNGIGAGITAAMIANRVAAARRGSNSRTAGS
jgi:NCAIR mutase (PurE)-related protein